MSKISLIIPAAPGKEIETLYSVKSQSKKPIVILEEGKNPSANRNRGIRKAKTPLVAFTNIHTILSDNWSEKVESFFKKYPKVDIVGGPQLNFKGDNSFARISGYALSSLFGASIVRNRYKKAPLSFEVDETMLTSANLICRKRVFNKLMFDEKIYPGEDPKFIADAKEKGFTVAYSPDIIVYNRRRSTLSAFVKQIFNYGRVRPLKESLRSTLTKNPSFLIPSLFVLYVLLLPALNLISVFFAIPLILYVALNLIFSLSLSIQNKDPLALFLLPVVFLAIHVSYGIGFIYGIFFEKK